MENCSKKTNFFKSLKTQFKGKSGIFISKIVPGGVADRAGFHVDDQLLAVNGQDMRGLGHNDAIELIQRSGEQLEFLVEREQLEQLPGEGTKMVFNSIYLAFFF